MKMDVGCLYQFKNQEDLYFSAKDGNNYWLIPVCKDIQKYNKIVDDKIKKYGFCNTILIRNIMNNKYAIVLENAFAISYKYENEIYKVKNIAISELLKNEILRNFKYMLRLKENDINLFSHSNVLDNKHMFI